MSDTADRGGRAEQIEAYLHRSYATGPEERMVRMWLRDYAAALRADTERPRCSYCGDDWTYEPGSGGPTRCPKCNHEGGEEPDTERTTPPRDGTHAGAATAPRQPVDRAGGAEEPTIYADSRGNPDGNQYDLSDVPLMRAGLEGIAEWERKVEAVYSGGQPVDDGGRGGDLEIAIRRSWAVVSDFARGATTNPGAVEQAKLDVLRLLAAPRYTVAEIQRRLTLACAETKHSNAEHARILWLLEVAFPLDSETSDG